MRAAHNLASARTRRPPRGHAFGAGGLVVVEGRRVALGLLGVELGRGACEAGVDRDWNGAGAHRGEEDLQELAAVADDHRDARARLGAELADGTGDPSGWL